MDASINKIVHQIKLEKSHQEQLEVERKKLLSESIERLSKTLQDTHDQTDWMFDHQHVDQGAPQPYGHLSERHFSLGRRL